MYWMLYCSWSQFHRCDTTVIELLRPFPVLQTPPWWVSAYFHRYMFHFSFSLLLSSISVFAKAKYWENRDIGKWRKPQFYSLLHFCLAELSPWLLEKETHEIHYYLLKQYCIFFRGTRWLERHTGIVVKDRRTVVADLEIFVFGLRQYFSEPNFSDMFQTVNIGL